MRIANNKVQQSESDSVALADSPASLPARQFRSGAQAGWIALLAAASVGLPALISVLISGKRGIFNLFAGDTFFYLAIARNRSWQPLFSFDGLYPTNGFHPLWQVILKGASCLFSLDSFSLIAFCFLLSVSAVAISAALLSLSAYRITNGRAVLSLFAVAPGFLYLASGMASPLAGSLVGFANGMESCLSLLFFSLLLLLLLRHPSLISGSSPAPGTSFAASILLTLIVLSRLDDIFLLAALALLIVFLVPERSKVLQRMLRLFWLPAVTVSLYMLINHAYAGSFIPASGLTKGGLSLSFNLTSMLNAIVPLRAMDFEETMVSSWRELTFRSLLLNLPACVALYYLLAPYHLLQKLRGRMLRNSFSNAMAVEHLLALLSLYIVFKWLYNLSYVQLWNQGSWYFPLSVMGANLILAWLIAQRMNAAPLTPGSVRWATLAVLGFSLFTSNNALAEVHRASHNPVFDTWKHRTELSRDLKALDPSMKIVAFDDGMSSYALDVPVMSGFGFAIDKQGSEAVRENRLLSLAYQRGFRYVTSVAYLESLEKQWKSGAGEYAHWSFTPVYEHPASGLRVYAFAPKPGPG